MSKDLFQLMREKEIATNNYLPTKKEIKAASTKLAKDMIDSGNFSKEEIYAQALRLKEAITTIEAELKKDLPEENFEAYGLKGTFREGGKVLNYNEDDIYANLKRQLKQREELLKTSFNTPDPIYDADGVEIPKVSFNYRKSSLSITY